MRYSLINTHKKIKYANNNKKKMVGFISSSSGNSNYFSKESFRWLAHIFDKERYTTLTSCVMRGAVGLTKDHV